MFESSVRNEPHGKVKKTLKPSLPEAMTKLTQTKPIQFKTKNELAKKLNDMVTKDSSIVVPLVHRGTLSAHSNALGGVKINAWDSELWNVADWFRVK